MAQKNIDFGTFPNDPDADAIRTAFIKTQENFTELFAGLQEQAVLSVNRTPGAGVTVFPVTGNVVVSANIACVTLTTHTLSLGLNGANGNVIAILDNSSTQQLTIDLPSNITGVNNASFAGTVTSNVFAANNSITSSNTITATGNIAGGNLTTGGALTVTGNANVGNIGAANGVFSANVTASNIYANSGTIGATTANLSGNLNASNVNADKVTANFFSGDGSNLTNVSALANTRIVNGTSYANIPVANGNLNIVINTTAVVNVSSTGMNVAGTGNFTGTLAVTGNANVGNLGTAQVLATANVTAPQLISNVATGTAPLVVTSTTQVANLNAATAGTAGTVTTAAQPNITSVGTLTSASVTGNVTAGNVYANSGTIGAQTLKGEGGNISNIQGANVSGTVSTATTAGTVTTNAQPNITSVGTLTSVAVTGNATAGNVYANSGTIGASLLTGTLTTNAQPNITSVGTLTSASVTGNVTAGNVYANSGTIGAGTLKGEGGNISNIQGANVSGAVATATSATTAGTVTTAAQPNITSVGTLTSLSVSGNVSGDIVISNNGGNGTNFKVGDDTWLGDINIADTLSIRGQQNAANGFIIFGNNDTTAKLGRSGAGPLSYTGAFAVSANITTPQLISNVATGTAPLVVTSTTQVANLNAATAGTVITAAQPNITSVGTLSSLAVTGNLSSGNANLGNLAVANFFQGDGSLLTNISIGAGSFIENGNSNVIVDANNSIRFSSAGNANVVVVNGSGANINGTANVSGNLSAGNISATLLTGTLATASQPNVTSLGTLSALNVNGVANLGAVANVRISGGSNNQVLVATGTGSNLAFITASGLTFAPGSNTQVLFNDAGSFAANANMTFDKTTGTLSSQALSVTTNITAGNVFANSGTVRGNLLTGTLTTAAQPNITSVGTLTSLIVGGNINAGNVTGGNAVTANFFIGSGNNLSNIQGSNVTGSVTSATNAAAVLQNTSTATTVYPTFTTSSANGNSSVVINTGISANLGNASITATTFVGALSGAATSATTAGTVTTNAQPNITSVGTLTGLTVNGNTSTGRLTINPGTVTSNVHALTVLQTWNNSSVQFSAIEANITDTASAANSLLLDLQIANVSKFAVSKEGNIFYSGVITGNGSGLSAIAGANVTGTVANATFATSAGSATTAGTVTTAAQPNITSVGTLSSLSVTGNISAGNVSATTFTGALSGAATTAGTVTTNAQPNITSVGTLSSLSVTGNVTAGNIVAPVANGNSSLTIPAAAGNVNISVNGTANVAVVTATGVNVAGTLNVTGNANVGNIGATRGVFTNIAGEGGNISNIQGANVSGTVSSATTAGTVTTAAQPNITSTGTLTSLTVSGNIAAQANVNMTGYVIRSVNAVVSAAGTAQGNATAITKEINVVSTVASGAGVVLPTAVAGMVITITNTSANSLLVYPAANGIINSQAANAAYSHSAGATLQYVAPTTTQWYTVGATFA